MKIKHKYEDEWHEFKVTESKIETETVWSTDWKHISSNIELEHTTKTRIIYCPICNQKFEYEISNIPTGNKRKMSGISKLNTLGKY